MNHIYQKLFLVSGVLSSLCAYGQELLVLTASVDGIFSEFNFSFQKDKTFYKEKIDANTDLKAQVYGVALENNNGYTLHARIVQNKQGEWIVPTEVLLNETKEVSHTRDDKEYVITFTLSNEE